MDLSKYVPKILPANEKEFAAVAIEIFGLQYHHNRVYHDYVNALKIDAGSIKTINQIPFLPIGFFKTHRVCTGDFNHEAVFESSGTTGSINSRHYIKRLALYEESFTAAFELFYGPATGYCILGLLPSYLERSNSSLVYMVNRLIEASGHPASGFYLGDFDRLSGTIGELERSGQKTILLGVTFALLDFAAQYPQTLRHTIVMETGGMKGRREEMVRGEVHSILKKAFALDAIHSEYGMTELLSQAYAKSNGRFHCPPSMQVLIRDDEDPFSVTGRDGVKGRKTGEREGLGGAINVIDLANIYSCSFIATDDAGRLYRDGSFEVLGRMDNSDLRGCSLMFI